MSDEGKNDSQGLTNESIQSYEQFHQEQITEHAKVADAVQAYLAASGQYGGSRSVYVPEGKLGRAHYRHVPQAHVRHVNFHRYGRYRGRGYQRSTMHTYTPGRGDTVQGGKGDESAAADTPDWLSRLWHFVFGGWPW